MLQSMRSLVGGVTTRLDDLKTSIGVELDELRSGLERVDRNDSANKGDSPNAMLDGGAPGPDGRRLASEPRGKDHNLYVPPPVRGMRSGQSSASASFAVESRREFTDHYCLGPRIEIPRFDGSNPRLWQTRSRIILRCGEPRVIFGFCMLLHCLKV